MPVPFSWRGIPGQDDSSSNPIVYSIDFPEGFQHTIENETKNHIEAQPAVHSYLRSARFGNARRNDGRYPSMRPSMRPWWSRTSNKAFCMTDALLGLSGSDFVWEGGSDLY